jgi:chemotaxis-related protein WspB
MLFVVFQLDSNRYAVSAEEVAEVLPFVEVATILDAPKGVAGLFRYRGHNIPAIDLSILLLGRPARIQFSTRIILAEPVTAGRHAGRLGLIVEQATEILRLERSDFMEYGLASTGSSYLGPFATTPLGLIRLIDLAKLTTMYGDHLVGREVLEPS